MTDALNSVIAQLSDDNASPGTLQNSYGYSPYGESTTVGPDATNNPSQYTSRENDQTGLMFYRARYYDPVLKRFISEDPTGLAAGLNGYRYVDNAPTEYSDPEGEIPIVPIAVAYAKCVASCMAQAAAGAALFDGLECFDVGDNAKDCALDCLNPFNWGGKAGLKKGIGKSRNKPPGPLKEAEGRPHTNIERPGRDGQYTTHNGDGTYKQYRGSGQDHGGIPRPNVKESVPNVAPNGKVYYGDQVRPALPGEVPK